MQPTGAHRRLMLKMFGKYQGGEKPRDPGQNPAREANQGEVVQSMTIFRVQPAGRNTGQKLTLQLGRGRTKPKEAKGRNRKEASEPGPSTVTMQPPSAQDGKTLPASQWCIASFRQGAANRAHTSVTGGKQPMVRFFLLNGCAETQLRRASE